MLCIYCVMKAHQNFRSSDSRRVSHAGTHTYMNMYVRRGPHRTRLTWLFASKATDVGRASGTFKRPTLSQRVLLALATHSTVMMAELLAANGHYTNSRKPPRSPGSILAKIAQCAHTQQTFLHSRHSLLIFTEDTHCHG